MSRAAPGRPQASGGPLGGPLDVPVERGADMTRAVPGRPKQAVVPSGDRSTYPSSEGLA
jgi:hypothetical protein